MPSAQIGTLPEDQLPMDKRIVEASGAGHGEAAH